MWIASFRSLTERWPQSDDGGTVHRGGQEAVVRGNELLEAPVCSPLRRCPLGGGAGRSFVLIGRTGGEPSGHRAGQEAAIVTDLTKDDFSLVEDGRPQSIRYFARESDLPLTIGLMVDTSMSQVKVLDAERGASFRFLDQVLRENKDHVFIMQFDLTVQTKQELTASRRDLDKALTMVDTPTRNQLRNQYGGGTLLFDAIVDAAQDTMSKQKGRKALIVLFRWRR